MSHVVARARPGGPVATPSPVRAAVPERQGPRLLRLQSTIGNQAVQRLMSTASFTRQTSGWGPRLMIRDIDYLLTAYHGLPITSYGERLDRLYDLAIACLEYEDTPSLFAHQKPAVRRLHQEVGLERDILGLLLRGVELAPERRFDSLREATAAVAAAQEKGADVAVLGAHVKSLLDVHTDVGRLMALVRSDDTPDLTRDILREILGNLEKTRFEPGRPGTRLTPSAARLPQRYTVVHSLEQEGGIPERLGSLAHELTHVSAGETFGSAPMFLLADPETTSDDLVRLANGRRDNVVALKRLCEASDALTGAQQALVMSKLDYALDKPANMLGLYAARFADVLVERFEKPMADVRTSDAERRRLADELRRRVAQGELLDRDTLLKFRDLARRLPHGNTLIEYDSVLSQILVYLQQWRIPVSDAFYAAMLRVAQEAYDRRLRHREVRQKASAGSAASGGSAGSAAAATSAGSAAAAAT